MKDELLIKLLLKEATAAEEQTIIQWLSSDPANQVYYDQLQKIWGASKKLAQENNVDEEQAWIKFKASTNARNEPSVVPLRKNLTWLKVAATLILTVGIWVVYSLLNTTGYASITAGNHIITHKLPDGSELTLNKNSSISYAENFKEDRSIKLTRGAVFFNVAHDKTRPFVIEINKVFVTVVGTSFHIKHINKQTEVIVETGIVKVKIGNEEIRLYKGEKVSIDEQHAKLVKMQNTDQLYNYYRSKLFVASNTPLYKLIETLNEAYGAQVTINDHAIVNQPITTTLKEEFTLAENLKTICETLDLKITRNQQQIILSKNQ